MDYSYFERAFKGASIKVGVIGATRGYGYTIISQLAYASMCRLRFVCSRHPLECDAVLRELGYESSLIKICSDAATIKEASDDDILIINDYALMVHCGIDTIVECTGDTSVGSHAAVMAIESGINVCMVSKETDSICGPYLNWLASQHGVAYSLANGDQPRNLVDLYSWAKILGLEVIAAGKSSENDLVYDSDSGVVTYLEDQPKAKVPQLADNWAFKGFETLDARKKALEPLLSPISADLCEMNLVSNITGLVPAAPCLNYPVARISELANVFIPQEDGGILDKTGVVDVFYNLRHPDEASFAGGEFVIVRCRNQKVWDMLQAKGHIVSSNGKYACLYYPYHLLGVETPASLILQKFLGVGTHPECRQVSVLVGVADGAIKKGTVLSVEGHHHEIKNIKPQLIQRTSAVKELLPFYVLNKALVLDDIKEGEPISPEKIKLHDSALYPHEIYKKGLEFVI